MSSGIPSLSGTSTNGSTHKLLRMADDPRVIQSITTLPSICYFAFELQSLFCAVSKLSSWNEISLASCCNLHAPFASTTKNGKNRLRCPGLLKRIFPFLVVDAEGACKLQRSEEHTSELQSHSDLACRLLLE